MSENLFFVYGQESFFIDQQIDSLLSKFVRTEQDEFNFEKFDSQNLDIGRLRSSILSMPMMSDKRIVLIRDLQFHFKGKISKDRQKDWDDLITNIPDYTIVIISALIESKSYSSYPWKVLTKKADVSEYPKLRFGKIDKAIDDLARNNGLKLDAEVLSYLKNQYDSDFPAIDLEIKKIKNFLPERDSVSYKEIAQLLSLSEKFTLNSLSDKLAVRNQRDVAEVIEGLLDAGVVLPLVLATYKNFFVSLFRYKEAVSRFSVQNEVARATGVPPFFLKNYRTASGKYSLSDIESILLSVADCEFRLKSLPISDKELASMWMIPPLGREKHSLALEHIKGLR